jgi:hypothetical protein
MSEGGESTELTTELFMDHVDRDPVSLKEKRWHKLVALSTLLFAMLAALGGLLSGITAHENQIEKIEEVINFTVLESDRVSVEVLKAKHEILVSLGESPGETELDAIRAYEAEIEEKQSEVLQEEFLARTFGQIHLIFAVSVTLLAVGISLSGMSVVIEQKWIWTVGLVFGAVGSIGVILGIFSIIS